MSDWKKKQLGFEDSAFNIYELDDAHEWYDPTTAKLLSITDAFINDIEKSRATLKIVYPDGSELEKLIATEFTFKAFCEHASKDMQPQFDNETRKIVNKYQLGNRWLLSIQLLLLTDQLFLPSSSPIELSVADGGIVFYEDQEGKISTSYSLIDNELKVSVTVSEKVTMNRLLDTIKNNPYIKTSLVLLTDTPKPRNQDDKGSLKWGYWVWHIKKYNEEITWDQITEKLLDLEIDEDVPDRVTLETFYKRFVKTLESTTTSK